MYSLALSRFLIPFLAALLLYCAFVLMQPVLVPCVTALVVAYMANPCVSALHKKLRLPRVWAALLVLLGSVMLLLLAMLLLLPLLMTQMYSLFESLLPVLQRMQILAPQWLQAGQQFLPAQLNDALQGDWQNILSNVDAKTVQASADMLARRFGPFIMVLLSGAQTIFSVLNFVVLMPLLAFYFLADWPALCRHVHTLIPHRHQPAVLRVLQQIDAALAAFLRGQFLVCMVQSAYYVLALSIIGTPYGVLIGCISGTLTFIPYVGALLGYGAAVVAILLVQGVEMHPQLMLAGVFLVGQLLEGYVWVPRLVGHSVGLNPAWSVIALAVCGALWGFLGLLLAMPLAAVMSVLVRVARQKYFATEYYNASA